MVRTSSLKILCGLALFLFVSSSAARAAGFAVLHTFKGGGDGASPQAGLIADKSGNLYGTTCGRWACGGKVPGTHCSKGCGNAYGFVNGDEEVLHFFKGRDGKFPVAPLYINNRRIFGTASEGGTHGKGVVFRLSRDYHREVVLYSFCGQDKCADGATPVGAVIADVASNLYGTTQQGGRSTACPDRGGCGIVFKLSPDGAETVLHRFCRRVNCADGALPTAGLIMDHAGNMYGTAINGGADDGGAVFRLGQDGTYTVLYSFCSQANCSDGASPAAHLTLDSQGNLYGTAGAGGGKCECGVVFKLAPDGTETVLHAFRGGGDGNGPESAVVMDGAGNLYGTTTWGGEPGGCAGLVGEGCGTIFEVTPQETESVLYRFKDKGTGSVPTGDILLRNSRLYGTASFGGDKACGDGFGCGTVFRLALQ
jgi:uncharacterized repeat protein (TIGR03803 family)